MTVKTPDPVPIKLQLGMEGYAMEETDFCHSCEHLLGDRNHKLVFMTELGGRGVGRQGVKRKWGGYQNDTAPGC